MTVNHSVEMAINNLLTEMNSKETRDYSYLHPSEMGDCHRKMYYKVMGIKPMVPPPPQTLRIFGNGHFVHMRYQMYLRDSGVLAKERVVSIDRATIKLGLTDVERVVIDGATGRKYYYEPQEWVWLCIPPDPNVPSVGGMKTPHTIRAEDLKVDDDIWMVEVPLFDPEHHFGGHADAVVRTPAGAAVIDFKSTNENNFAYLFHDKDKMDEYHLSYPHKHFQMCHICGDTISRWKDYNDHLLENHCDHISVDDKHKVQLNVYMWLLGLDHGILLYENKNTQVTICQPVERDDILIAKIKSDSLDIWRNVEAGIPPDRPYSSRSKFPCAYCDFVSQCWS